jgi:hypothetical protein
VKGTVFQINQARGIVAVQTDDGDFSILELCGADPLETGDVVSWEDDTALGGEALANYTQGEKYEVYFQNHHVAKNQLRQQLRF